MAFFGYIGVFMCGIIGFSGKLDAKKVILDGLTTLEYRGYDSCGVCVVDTDHKFSIVKSTGKVIDLLPKVDEIITKETHVGIGHTRWATHGGVITENAHPHHAGLVNLIHNGIIENYLSLREQYKLDNALEGGTDTEIVANILNLIYKKNKNEPLSSIKKLTDIIKGTFAFLIMFEDRPDEVYAIKHVSPLVCAKSNDGSFIASDITALMPYTKEFSVIEEGTIVCADKDSLKAYDLKTLKEISLKTETITWSVDTAKKDGYNHFMLKEIHEQCTALENTIKPRIVDFNIDLSNDGIEDNAYEFFKKIEKIHIVACGTALHAGKVGASVFQDVLNIPVDDYIASEYRYSNTLTNDKTLVIVLSQSGETIDTLASLEKAKSKGAKVISIVNVKGSTIARNSDYVLYTHAGPEIAVASTKAYTVQVATIYLLLTKIASVRGAIDRSYEKSVCENLYASIGNIKTALQKENEIKDIVKYISSSHDAFYIGRGLDYVFSLEGALKLKEISYIHTEAYAAGELKHGTIALIEDGTPVIAVCTQSDIATKFLSNVKEVKARNAYVILIITDGIKYEKDLADIVIKIDKVDDKFSVFPVAVITQLIAYYTAYTKGLDIDKPRNLAKSVTVE